MTDSKKSESDADPRVMRPFNGFRLDVATVKGGTIVTVELLLDGDVVDRNQAIVAGNPGTNALNARIRRTLKEIALSAYPKISKEIEKTLIGSVRG